MVTTHASVSFEIDLEACEHQPTVVDETAKAEYFTIQDDAFVTHSLLDILKYELKFPICAGYEFSMVSDE